MVQFGRPVSMHPVTHDSLDRALFERGTFVLEPVAEYSDEERDWSDVDALSVEPPTFPSEGWSWRGPETTISGAVWGGSLEIVDFISERKYLLADDAYDGCISGLSCCVALLRLTPCRRREKRSVAAQGRRPPPPRAPARPPDAA